MSLWSNPIKDFKLKVILTVLSAVLFSFIFILLALVVPIKEEPVTFEKKTKPKHHIEEISRSFGEALE